MGVCTHCGQSKRTTRDHVIPTCLWVGRSDERAIMVPSCSECNCNSEEGLLKSFLALFDERLAPARLGDELLRPQGKGDLRSFLRVCTPELGKAYAEERVTRLFTKMFQGLRRHLLGAAWTFVRADDVSVFGLTRIGAGWSEARRLPLKVGGPNRGVLVPSDFADENHLTSAFRAFSFGFLADGWVGLKYGRDYCGNELILACAFTAGGRTAA